MLGLGLSITSVSGLRSLASKLLGILRSRSTYSENNVSSNAIVDDIDNVGILDKASILLTPTAYSDARVHSVKTYTGDELATNGTFDTDADWSKSEGWTIVNGKAIHDGLSSFKKISQLITTVVGNTYRYEATVSNLTTSQVYLMARVGNEFGTIIFNNLKTENGTYVFYFKALSTTTAIVFQNGNSNEVSIDNVSVKDVSSDFDFDRASSATRINSDGLVQDMQSITDPELVLNSDFEELGDDIVTNGTFDTDGDWTKGTGWSIANGKASNDGSGGSNNLRQSNILTIGSTYKITITVSDYVSGNVEVSAGASPRGTMSANGTYTFYQETTPSDDFYIIANAFTGSIDNVSVQQVDPNDRWTVVGSDADNYVEFTEGFARLKFLNTSPITTFRSSSVALQANKTYELVVDVHDVTSGAIKIDGAGLSELFNTEGVTTRYLTPTGNTALDFYRATADVDITLASVSIKDITFSTDVDLARINYDSNGENGHWLLEPTSTNLLPYSDNFSEWTIQSGTTVTSSTTETLSPSGEYNSSKIVGNGTSGILKASVSSAGGSNTKSIYIKGTQNGQVVYLKDPNQTVNNKALTLTTEWVRYSLTETQTSGYGIWISNIPTEGIYMWGGQVEALSHPTSYIPTYGSTVTRAAETLTGSGNSTLINSTEGVLYAEISALANDGSNRRISISDGSDTNRLNLFYTETTNEIKANYRVSNSTVVTIDTTDFNITNFNKIAFRWQSSNFALFINGENKGTNSNTTMISANTLNVLRFEDPNLVNEFYGKCKALAVFDRALTNRELENLTR